LILGLTGFSGAGKSTVAAILKEHGYYVLDCDKLVHEDVYRDPAVIQAISFAFGKEVLKSGILDRAALRACTMGDPAATEKLNQTMMPYIVAHIEQVLRHHKNEPIVLDAPLLFESGLDQRCDQVLSVIAPPEKALERIMIRDRLTREEAEKRRSSQHPAEYYSEKSDYTIINDEGISEVTKKTLELLRQIHDQSL